jgi:hypothetical protein
MNEVTTLYGLLGILITSIGVPITTHFLQRKHSKRGDRSVRLSLKRLELLDAFRHDSGNTKLINRLYDEYGEMGGNSYIDDIMNEWKNGTLEDDTTELSKRLKNVEKLIENGKAA